MNNNTFSVLVAANDESYEQVEDAGRDEQKPDPNDGIDPSTSSTPPTPEADEESGYIRNFGSLDRLAADVERHFSSKMEKNPADNDRLAMERDVVLSALEKYADTPDWDKKVIDEIVAGNVVPDPELLGLIEEEKKRQEREKINDETRQRQQQEQQQPQRTVVSPPSFLDRIGGIFKLRPKAQVMSPMSPEEREKTRNALIESVFKGNVDRISSLVNDLYEHKNDPAWKAENSKRYLDELTERIKILSEDMKKNPYVIDRNKIGNMMKKVKGMLENVINEEQEEKLREMMEKISNMISKLIDKIVGKILRKP